MGEVIGVKLPTDQLVLTRGRDFKWSFENLDDSVPPVPTDFPAGSLFLELQTRQETNAVQQVVVYGASSGSYLLGFKDQWTAPISFDAVTDNPQNLSGDIKDAIEAMSTVGTGNIDVTPSTLYPVWELDITLNQGANEVQQIQITGNPTGGYFTLTFRSHETPHLAFNASAVDIQAALEALPSIGTGNVAVTGSNPTFTVTFQGDLALQNVPQIVPTYTHRVDFIFVFRTLTGGTKPSVLVTTTTPGSTPLSQSTVNTLNTTLNTVFNSLDGILGVTVDITVWTSYNLSVVVKSTHSFNENGLKTFIANVTSTTLQNAFNLVPELLGLFDVIHVAFFWEHTFQVEFINALGLQPQPALVSDVTSLESLIREGASVDVTVVNPGKAPTTKWNFDISGSLGIVKVESEEADLIPNRTDWQLVFLPDGEPAGGDPIARGVTAIQMPNAYIKGVSE